MKYGETLKENLTSEWKSQYVNYEGLKKIICAFDRGVERRGMYFIHYTLYSSVLFMGQL